MVPDAEDCEEVKRLSDEYQEVPVHQGRRILPNEPPLVQAWIENEDAGPGQDSRTNSPGENRRLLGHDKPKKPSHRRQYELNLAAYSKKKLKCTTLTKPKEKSKFQKRKKKIIEALRPPYFIITMIILIVLLYHCSPSEWRQHLEWLPGPRWREPWRLLTYGLVHATTSHLALNALVALAVGWRLEQEQGWARVAALWLGGVACGALGASVLQPDVIVVGASAAVYTLLTAHIPNVCLRYGHIPLWWFRPLSVVVLCASEALWELRCTPGDNDRKVAWSAHIFGALVGIVLGFIVFTGENSSKTYTVICRTTSFILLVTGGLTAIVFFVFKFQADLT